MATRAWYRYNRTPGGHQDPINYFYVSSEPPCALTGTNICAVLGIYQDVADYPANFSDRLNSYISTALSTGSAQPTFGTKYVFVKN